MPLSLCLPLPLALLSSELAPRAPRNATQRNETETIPSAGSRAQRNGTWISVASRGQGAGGGSEDGQQRRGAGAVDDGGGQDMLWVKLGPLSALKIFEAGNM